MDVPAFLEQWGLEDSTDVVEMTSGSVNRVFRVTTTNGRVYLRVYRTRDRDVVAREHALLAHIAARGLPAVPPIPTTRGETVVVLEGTPCALYPEAAGRQVEKAALETAHAVAAGELMGRLHQGLATMPDLGFRRYALRWSRDAWIERLAGIAEAVRARGSHPDDALVLQRIRDQCVWLADPTCEHAYEATLEPQLVHGDYQHANLFFERGAVSAVIDWEQAAYLPCGFEVARAAAYMFDLAPEPTRALVAAYRAITHVSDEDLDEGARAWGCMSDHYVWALEEVYLQGNERARRFIPLPFRPFRRAWEAANA